MNKYTNRYKNVWRIFLVVILVLGIFFRFAALDHKAYSADEVRSVLRLTGSTSQEFRDQFQTGEITTAETILTYQRLSPDRPWSNTFHALIGNPEHPPLYGVLTRALMQVWNAAITARLASILFGLLAIAALYGWCRELFGQTWVAEIAIALVAVSPYHIVLAQNTTQYSLLTLIVCGSSWAFLRAVRSPRWRNWLAYGLLVTVGVYTHLFYALVAFGHGVYLLLVERFRWTGRLMQYLTVSIGAAVLFSPWAYIILTNLDTIDQNTRYYESFKTTPKEIFQVLGINIAHLFFDSFNRFSKESILVLALVGFVIYSLYDLCRHAPRRTTLFLLLIIAITPIVQIVPDLFGTSIRSLQARYYLPSFLTLHVVVAYALARHLMPQDSTALTTADRTAWQTKLWSGVLVGLLSLGVVSGTIYTKVDSWEPGTASTNNLLFVPLVQKSIQQGEHPLIISAATHSFVLALAHHVAPETPFQLLDSDNPQQWQAKLDLPGVMGHYQPVFVMYPNPKFLKFIQDHDSYSLKPVVVAKKQPLFYEIQNKSPNKS